MKISVDGGGVFPDEFMSDGHRLRLSSSDDPSEDVTVYFEAGELHVVGQYAVLLAEREAPNHVTLRSVRPVALR